MTFVERLKTTVTNLKGVVENKTNKLIVTEKTRNDRLETCKTCEKFIASTSQCKLCGCFMKPKTWLIDAKCPAGKW